MVSIIIFPYVKYVASETEGLSSFVITKCMTSFFTSHENPSHLNGYVANPSSSRYAAYHIREYIRVGAAWILEEKSSSGAYGKVKLTPSLTSDSGTRTVTPTRSIQ